MSLVNGVDGKLYYLSTGTRASWGGSLTNGEQVGPAPGNLAEIDIVQDIEVGQDKEKADVTTRRTKYKATKGTLIGVSFDIPMVYDVANAGLLAMDKAFFTGAVIALAVLDGGKAVAGSRGLWADFEVVNRKKGEPLNGAQTIVYTVEPAYSAVPPENVKVSA